MKKEKLIQIVGYVLPEAMKKHCQRCNYEWKYGGILQRPTCPSCGARVTGAKTVKEAAARRKVKRGD